ncbi:MAG: hypothetical protein ACEPOZ_03530 [Marinifilaceae bacterium]
MEESITLTETKKRPNFLTVLCIITFIYSGGFGLLFGLYSHFTFQQNYEKAVPMIEEGIATMEAAGASGYFYENAVFGLEKMEIMKENLNAITGANSVFAILCILGALLMFMMKKNGFFLYTFASLFWLLVPIYFFDFGTPNLINVGFQAFFALLFIILYATNLKHMK